MNVTATKVVEQSAVEVEKQRQLTGTMAPPPPAPPTDVPILVAEATPPAPSAAPREAAPEKLPRTGSDLPLIALVGFLLLAAGLGVRAFRKSRGNKPMGDRTVL
jgi:LPXTG-motif cell wall-anchored protein